MINLCFCYISGDVSIDKFYEDPFAKDGHSFRFQLMMYAMRFRQYADVLQHLLETGTALTTNLYWICCLSTIEGDPGLEISHSTPIAITNLVLIIIILIK